MLTVMRDLQRTYDEVRPAKFVKAGNQELTEMQRVSLLCLVGLGTACAGCTLVLEMIAWQTFYGGTTATTVSCSNSLTMTALPVLENGLNL
jgi:hypothetical protein